MHTSIFLLLVAGGVYASILLSNHIWKKVSFLMLIIAVNLIGINYGMGELLNPKTPIIAETTMDFPKTVVGAELDGKDLEVTEK